MIKQAAIEKFLDDLASQNATPGGGSGTSGSSTAGSSTGGSGGTGIVAIECPETSAAAIDVAWEAINSQPAAFYGSDEARTLADNILYYQNADHGWPKNTDMIAACHEQKLLAIAAGDNVVRLLPPLTVNVAEISEAVDCLDRACLALEKSGAVQAMA